MRQRQEPSVVTTRLNESYFSAEHVSSILTTSFTESKLNESIDRLTKHPPGDFLTGHTVGKTRNLDDPLVRKENLRLPACSLLDFDNDRRQPALRRS